MFDAAIQVGAKVVNAQGNDDLVLVDYSALIVDSLTDDLDEAEVLLARMTAAHAKGLYVGGQEIMRDGKLTRIDHEGARAELLKQARADLPRLTGERQRVTKLAAATRAYYSGW
ncbi:hypothetical protein D9M69_602960 [compost metagenome]